MTKIVIPDARTLLGQTREENQRLREELQIMTTAGIIEVAVRNPNVMEWLQHWEERAERAEEELAKVREVNGEQAKTIARLMEDQRQAQQRMRVAGVSPDRWRLDELYAERDKAWNAAIEAAAFCIEGQTWWVALSQGHIGAKKPADYAEAILALKKPGAE